MASLCERALAVAQSALVYSDIHFLFPPDQIAFAAVAIALEGNCYGGRMGTGMRSYFRMRFPQKSEEELRNFERDITSIICNLTSCPAIDLNKFWRSALHSSRRSAQIKAGEVRHVFAIVSSIRISRIISVRANQIKTERNIKRAREEVESKLPRDYFKAAKVTPVLHWL
jgi:hypothetical protein